MSARHGVAVWLRHAQRAGWRVQPTGSGHWKLTPLAGGMIIVSATPSDRRALRALAVMLRRTGLRIDSRPPNTGNERRTAATTQQHLKPRGHPTAAPLEACRLSSSWTGPQPIRSPRLIGALRTLCAGGWLNAAECEPTACHSALARLASFLPRHARCGEIASLLGLSHRSTQVLLGYMLSALLIAVCGGLYTWQP